jgi:serine/threonine protein phosphatase PrpC
MDDNEDLARWTVTEDGAVHAALLDGITGEGDGSGRAAAVAAINAARACWREARFEPRLVLRAADDAVQARAGDGGAAAVFATLPPRGRAELASVGDSAAWLVRPHEPERPERYSAWRLTPAHTDHAERLRRDPRASGGRSVLTRHLGGAAARPFTIRFHIAPGDLVVLVSDGAAENGTNGEWFGAELARLAEARSAKNRPLGPGLAADLVIRAEQMGGHDNATAIVAEVTRSADADGNG